MVAIALPVAVIVITLTLAADQNYCYFNPSVPFPLTPFAGPPSGGSGLGLGLGSLTSK
jgi:hypothetical protein